MFISECVNLSVLSQHVVSTRILDEGSHVYLSIQAKYLLCLPVGRGGVVNSPWLFTVFLTREEIELLFGHNMATALPFEL